MILRIKLLLIGLLIMINLTGQNFERYKWENRILIIKAPNKEHINYKNQISEFINSAEALADRKMLIYEIVGDKFKKTNYLLSKNDTNWKTIETVEKREWSKVNKFKIRLIGLDGGIKFQKEGVIKKEELFEIID